MRAELFLALRYLKPKRNAVSVITVVSIVGVALGVGVLMIVLAVMTGFSDTMKTKLIETQAHIQIKSAYGNIAFEPQTAEKIAKKSGVRNCAAVVTSPVMLQVGRKLDVQMLLMGVELEQLLREPAFAKAMVAGSPRLERREVIISAAQAKKHGISVGEKVLLHSPNKLIDLVDFKPDGSFELNGNKSIYLPAEFTVSGVYEMGKYDFDRSVIFISLDDADEFLGLPWGTATKLFCWVDDPFAMKRELAALRSSLPEDLRAVSWQEENAPLLGVLQVEKNMMFFLLIFIVLVAAFSIANTLITSVYQKTRDIGVMKSLGASGGNILSIFVYQGFLVGLCGSAGGVALGSTVIFFRNDILEIIRRLTGQDLFPREFYVFNELPAHVVPGDVGIIIVSSILLCTLGALIPALRAAKLDPAKALRYE